MSDMEKAYTTKLRKVKVPFPALIHIKEGLRVKHSLVLLP